jgi:Raf kinase inhibitor-like YbhB/YbcL family protein
LRPVAALAAAAVVVGCGGSSSSPPRVRIDVTSPAFVGGAAIPSQFTCQGADISPPLQWSGIPHGARELALVMRDRDAPGGNFIHWQVTAISPSTRGLAAGEIPAGARAGRNDFGKIGYGGPCPPPGRAHHYVITLTARNGAAVYGSGTLVGTYARR